MTAEWKAVPLPCWHTAVQRARRGADEREVGGVGGQRRREGGRGGGRAHPQLEFRWGRSGVVEIRGGAGFPRDDVEARLVLRRRQRPDRCPGLLLGFGVGGVQGDRRGGDDPRRLFREHWRGREGPSLMVDLGPVPNFPVGLPLSRKQRVNRFDGLVRAGRLRGTDELAEQWATEDAVVTQALIGSGERRDVAVAVSGRNRCGSRQARRSLHKSGMIPSVIDLLG